MDQGSRRGFTIVELVIVVIVVAIFAAIVVVAYRGITGSAQEAALKSELQGIEAKLGRYKAKNGVYPDSLAGVGMTSGGELQLIYGGGGDKYCTSAQRDTLIIHVRQDGRFGSGPCPVMWDSIASGTNGTCAVAYGGDVYCWGFNLYGQLGDGTSVNRLLPTRIQKGAIPSDAFVRQVSVGQWHACALASNNSVYCWGYNTVGQLGDGTNQDRSVPTLVQQGAIPTGATVKSISAGETQSCAVTTAGGVYCWGSNANGRLGDGTTVDRNVPVVIQMPGGVAIDSVSVGNNSATGGNYNNHICARSISGGAYCWGNNSSGQLGDGTTTSRTSPVAVQYGSASNAIPADVTIREITTGSWFTCAIASNDQAYCWGYNLHGQLGVGNTVNSPAKTAPLPISQGDIPEGAVPSSITASGRGACITTTALAMYCWGANNNGQVGDGTVVNRTVAAAVQSGDNIQGRFIAASKGDSHTCGIADDNTAYCWGFNIFGRLGDGTTTTRNVPTPVQLTTP